MVPPTNRDKICKDTTKNSATPKCDVQKAFKSKMIALDLQVNLYLNVT